MLHVCRQQGRCERPLSRVSVQYMEVIQKLPGRKFVRNMGLPHIPKHMYLRFPKKRKYDYVPLEQQVDILEDCERNELLKEMYLLIKRLNKVDRMFILLWLDEKSYDEIAEITGTSRNNVAIKLHRIKEKLKNMSNL